MTCHPLNGRGYKRTIKQLSEVTRNFRTKQNKFC